MLLETGYFGLVAVLGLFFLLVFEFFAEYRDGTFGGAVFLVALKPCEFCSDVPNEGVF